MKTIASMFFLILCAFSFSAWAGRSTPINYVETSAWVVGTYISEEGESREQFVIRVAEIMQNWTNHEGAELCGYLAYDGNKWGIKLITHFSQVMCVMDPDIVPKGFVAENDNIHSHPTPGPRNMILITDKTREAARKAGIRMTEYRTEILEGFSDDDYMSGPGYLVSNGRLFYQHGRKKIREISTLPMMVLSASN